METEHGQRDQIRLILGGIQRMDRSIAGHGRVL